MRVKGVILTASGPLSASFELGPGLCPWCGDRVHNSHDGNTVCDWCFENVWVNLSFPACDANFPKMLKVGNG